MNTPKTPGGGYGVHIQNPKVGFRRRKPEPTAQEIRKDLEDFINEVSWRAVRSKAFGFTNEQFEKIMADSMWRRLK